MMLLDDSFSKDLSEIVLSAARRVSSSKEDENSKDYTEGEEEGAGNKT
jgi:hypothetical protein